MKKSFLVVAFGLLVSLTMSSCILIVGGDDPKETSIKLTVTSPTNGQLLDSTNVAIEGTVIETNGFGVEAVYYAIDDDTTFTTAVLVDGDWAVDTNLSVGAHTFYAYAMDSSNNSTPTNTISFMVDGPGFLLITNATEETDIDAIYSALASVGIATNTVWGTADYSTKILPEGGNVILEFDSARTLNLKMEVSNRYYEETAGEDIGVKMAYVVYQTDIAITPGATNTFILKPACLEIVNSHSASMTYMTTEWDDDPSTTLGFDFLNLVLDGNTGGDVILTGATWNNLDGNAADTEIVAGSYNFITASSSTTNLFSEITLEPFTYPTISVTNSFEFDNEDFF